MNIILDSTQKHNKIFPRCRTVTGFLRNVVTRLVYGNRGRDGKPYPACTKEVCADIYNLRGFGEFWKADRFARHQAGRETLYFFGTENCRAPYSLVMLDIDVQKAQHLGSIEGGRAAAQHLSTLFRGSYWEPSTNGNGMHGYLLLHKLHCIPEQTKIGLSRLQDYVRAQTAKFDVETVEVKGAPCLIAWAGRKIDHIIKYGSFGKLPRHATLSQLQQMPIVNLLDLLRLCPDPQPSYSMPNQSQNESVRFDIADDHQLGCLEQYSARFVDDTVRVRRKKITSRDYAIALAVLLFCYRHPNPDGSMPRKRIEFLWSKVDSGFCCTKWQYICDTLDRFGLLNLVSCEYRAGQAKRWSLTEATAVTLSYLLGEGRKRGGS